MSLPILCQVLGNIVDIGLAPAAGVSIRFLPEPDQVRRASDVVVIPTPMVVAVPTDGEIDVGLIPGRYAVVAGQGSTAYKRFLITVPESTLAYLAQIIDAPLPESLDAAEQAVLDAQTARDVANLAAAGASADRVAAETARTGAEAAQSGAEAAEAIAVAAQGYAEDAQAKAESAQAFAESARDAALAANTNFDGGSASTAFSSSGPSLDLGSAL